MNATLQELNSVITLFKTMAEQNEKHAAEYPHDNDFFQGKAESYRNVVYHLQHRVKSFADYDWRVDQ